MREIGIVTIAVALLSLAFVLLVAAPAAPASAHQQEDAAAPMMPAGNGLDIAAPVTIGLGLLFLGTVMVGCAFLATGRQDRRGSAFGSGR